MATTTDSEILMRSLASDVEYLTTLSSKNDAMIRCLELAQIASKSATPVLIIGESGAGKSLLAMTIHYSSPKRHMPCVTMKCAGIREHELKSRLFGQAESRPGVLAKSAGGTLIIDAVDQLPSFVQKELLKVLAERAGEVRADSENSAGQSGQATARLISTSGSELSTRATSGIFMEDLIYRLGEITIRIPPLRERREDIVDLAEIALRAANRAYGKKVTKLSRTALDFIRHYDFPGNIRELFLVLNRAVRETPRDTIYVEDLGLVVNAVDRDPHLDSDMTMLPLWEMEKRHIGKALLRTGWKKGAAARLLRISETMLNRKIKLYGLERGSRPH